MSSGDRGICPECGDDCAVSTKGTLRRHPKGAEEPCSGSGYPVRAADGEERPTTAAEVADPTAVVREPQRLVPGVYRSSEPMLETGTPPPPGHVTVSVLMQVPFDGSNGRSPRQEAALLYDDPGYLVKVMSACPNERIRVAMKVERQARADHR